ncbi:MAG: PTS galactosamine/N-acetylgalactosamine transporter subunit IIA [Endozoicomonas sp. (ex Botrylloides leachii)]|nr:PTS galactosamine/N-acetylgalactosamine transporter subunit IIA [Endozoicomonas sp. (ex Botrylloides leachii)]
MIGLVITGHLNFASGYQSAVIAIAGDSPQVEYVDFLGSMSPNQLEEKLREAVNKVNSGEGVLFLTDIPGGSPFQRSAHIASTIDKADVISGTSLVMAAEACLEREGMELSELVAQLMETGVDNIKSLKQKLKSAKKTYAMEEGI